MTWLRDSPILFVGKKDYPKTWWDKQPKYFFPRWFPEPQLTHSDWWQDTFGFLWNEENDLSPSQVRTTASALGASGKPEWLLSHHVARAMIKLALEDIARYSNREKQLRLSVRIRRHAQEAVEWIFGAKALLFSFSACCDLLGIDTEAARAQFTFFQRDFALSNPRKPKFTHQPERVNFWRPELAAKPKIYLPPPFSDFSPKKKEESHTLTPRQIAAATPHDSTHLHKNAV